MLFAMCLCRFSFKVILSTHNLNLGSPLDSLLANWVGRTWLSTIVRLCLKKFCSFPSSSWILTIMCISQASLLEIRNHITEIVFSPLLARGLLASPLTASWWQKNEWAQLRSVKPGSAKAQHRTDEQSHELNKYCFMILRFPRYLPYTLLWQ